MHIYRFWSKVVPTGGRMEETGGQSERIGTVDREMEAVCEPPKCQQHCPHLRLQRPKSGININKVCSLILHMLNALEDVNYICQIVIVNLSYCLIECSLH
jgi:hypothetical protein